MALDEQDKQLAALEVVGWAVRLLSESPEARASFSGAFLRRNPKWFFRWSTAAGGDPALLMAAAACKGVTEGGQAVMERVQAVEEADAIMRGT